MPGDDDRFELDAPNPKGSSDQPKPSPAASNDQSQAPQFSKIPDPEPVATKAEDVSGLGAALATAMAEKYQPVILFGTANSGKTTILLSLFSYILSQPKLKAGLFLSNPVLSISTVVGERLHQDARHTFEIKTQEFAEGKKTAKTAIDLPFFIPVELRPADDKPPVKFAFLESNGEWYRPTRDGNSLFPALKSQIEDFISTFQGGIIFLYLLPYTQLEVYSDRDENIDAEQIRDASLAMSGVARAYDRIRANHRAADQHLILVTKWDADSITSLDRAADLIADRKDVDAFCERRYPQAVAALKGMQLGRDQLRLQAYCADLINHNGRLPLRADDDVTASVQAYARNLWSWLYSSALQISDQPKASPFPEGPKKPAFFRLINTVLDKITS